MSGFSLGLATQSFIVPQRRLRLLLVHPQIIPLLDEDFSRDEPLFDLDARALRILVRLQQPFDTLLLASSSSTFGGDVVE